MAYYRDSFTFQTTRRHNPGEFYSRENFEPYNSKGESDSGADFRIVLGQKGNAS
jgi:hypothetical protein